MHERLHSALLESFKKFWMCQPIAHTLLFEEGIVSGDSLKMPLQPPPAHKRWSHCRQGKHTVRIRIISIQSHDKPQNRLLLTHTTQVEGYFL